MSTQSPKLIRVAHLLRLFTKYEFEAKVNSGTYTERERIKEHKEVSYPYHQEGTTRGIYEYYEGEIRVAVVCKIVQPDGTLGGSGHPDPKHLLVEGQRYYCHGGPVEEELIRDGKFPDPPPELERLLS